MGNIADAALTDIWKNQFNQLRATHADGQWQSLPLCQQCRAWHRP
jgi:hypothetical protein